MTPTLCVEVTTSLVTRGAPYEQRDASCTCRIRSAH